ncbi:Uncharacterised protein [Mycobacteroides abscessus subsp. abscessus]|nr:Uncharacterised protein [Mycobacteroides abscessus subsp. abscessus]
MLIGHRDYTGSRVSARHLLGDVGAGQYARGVPGQDFLDDL